MSLNPVPFIDGDAATGYRVGARDIDAEYDGPVADVSVDGRWLYVSTDAYEGTAMLNVEALGSLIEALQGLRAALKEPA